MELKFLRPVTIYVSSYLIFYVIYKVFTKQNNNILDKAHVAVPKANNGIFAFSFDCLCIDFLVEK